MHQFKVPPKGREEIGVGSTVPIEHHTDVENEKKTVNYAFQLPDRGITEGARVPGNPVPELVVAKNTKHYELKHMSLQVDGLREDTVSTLRQRLGTEGVMSRVELREKGAEINRIEAWLTAQMCLLQSPGVVSLALDELKTNSGDLMQNLAKSDKQAPYRLVHTILAERLASQVLDDRDAVAVRLNNEDRALWTRLANTDSPSDQDLDAAFGGHDANARQLHESLRAVWNPKTTLASSNSETNLRDLLKELRKNPGLLNHVNALAPLTVVLFGAALAGNAAEAFGVAPTPVLQAERKREDVGMSTRRPVADEALGNAGQAKGEAMARRAEEEQKEAAERHARVDEIHDRAVGDIHQEQLVDNLEHRDDINKGRA